MDETKAPLSLHLPYFSGVHFFPHPMPTSCQNFWLPSWCTLPSLHLLGSRGLDVSSLSWGSRCWQPSCSDTSRRSSSSLRPGLPPCLPGIRGYWSCWFSTLQVSNLQGGWGLAQGYTRVHQGPEHWLTSLVTAISPWSWRISSPFSPLMVGVKNPELWGKVGGARVQASHSQDSKSRTLTKIYMNWNESRSVVSDSLWPHGLYSPWDSPGQNDWSG